MAYLVMGVGGWWRHVVFGAVERHADVRGGDILRERHTVIEGWRAGRERRDWLAVPVPGAVAVTGGGVRWWAEGCIVNAAERRVAEQPRPAGRIHHRRGWTRAFVHKPETNSFLNYSGVWMAFDGLFLLTLDFFVQLLVGKWMLQKNCQWRDRIPGRLVWAETTLPICVTTISRWPTWFWV